MKYEFSRQIFEKYRISNFMQTRPVGAELFHVDRRADVTKVIVTFRNLENAPKKRASNTRLLLGAQFL